MDSFRNSLPKYSDDAEFDNTIPSIVSALVHSVYHFHFFV